MSLKNEYEKLKQDREEFLQRGHRNSILTIPAALPLEGQQRHQLPQNFQSIGSRGVNNLSSKLLLTLFPPTLPFMRLKVAPSTMASLVAEAGSEDKAAAVMAEVEASLSRIEKEAVSEFDQDGWRPALAEGLRQAVITGNALLYDRPGGLRPAAYDMRRYVVERDDEGTLLTVILQQALSKDAMRQALRESSEVSEAALEAMIAEASTNTEYGSNTGQPSYALFTGAKLQPDGKYSYWQEIGSIEIPGTRAEVAREDLPLIPLMFQPVYGSSYGRGYVEDYDGDLLALESISRALVEGSLALAKILWLVKPGGSTKPSTLSESPNGAIRQGDPDDVGTLQAEKGSDLAVANLQQERLERRLSYAFLLNSSAQRSGERVTAEEIRFVAQELEDTLGGVYSSLADTVQAPVVFYLFNKLKRTGRIGKLPKSIKPIVATGLEAISRNHEVVRAQQFIEMIERIVPPEERSIVLKTDTIAQDIATSLNLDSSRFVRTPDEIEARRQAQAEQAFAERVGPNAVNQLGAAAQQQQPDA